MTDNNNNMFKKFKERVYAEAGDLWHSDSHLEISLSEGYITVKVDTPVWLEPEPDPALDAPLNFERPRVETRQLKAYCVKWGAEEFQDFEDECFETLGLPLSVRPKLIEYLQAQGHHCWRWGCKAPYDHKDPCRWPNGTLMVTRRK